MNEDKQEVLRGHLEECLRHFGSRVASIAPKGSREISGLRKLVADFCEVEPKTVARWLQGDGSLPLGEPLIKLMCYLDMMGYRVIELERAPKGKRNFMELIGYGFLSGEEAIELLEYSDKSALYKMLRGQLGVSEDKEQKMWDLWKEKKEGLQIKKDRSREFHRLKIQPKNFTREEVLETLGRQATSRKKAIISIMEGLLALLDEISLEKLPEDDLVSLQQATNTVSLLSARLSALSSQLTSERQTGGS